MQGGEQLVVEGRWDKGSEWGQKCVYVGKDNRGLKARAKWGRCKELK